MIWVFQIASLAYLCSLFFNMASCKSFSVDLEKGAPSIRENPTRSWKSHDIRRSYKLYNQCSGNHVQVVGKLVNAKGSADNPFVNMSFISARSRHHQNAINIVGQKTKNYVCFNKKGKLIVRKNGRKKLCLFREDLSKDHYTVLQSLYDPTWYVGFNRRGKPLRGSQYSLPKLQNCFHFVKRDHSYSMDEYIPPVKIKPWRLKELLTEGHGHHRSRQQRKVPKTPTR
ncbi:fibroblast growth factor 8b [Caerostris darwini]|uniref:Fibroblast growth factor 8b n=1 Tax=Caerostris darwini TaxID=1538125 RepID=A0AAV4PHJ5_9ARAC|nr:fibroblast growth factor 8b [Caerostris darwini]